MCYGITWGPSEDCVCWGGLHKAHLIARLGCASVVSRLCRIRLCRTNHDWQFRLPCGNDSPNSQGHCDDAKAENHSARKDNYVRNLILPLSGNLTMLCPDITPGRDAECSGNALSSMHSFAQEKLLHTLRNSLDWRVGQPQSRTMHIVNGWFVCIALHRRSYCTP